VELKRNLEGSGYCHSLFFFFLRDEDPPLQVTTRGMS
jgi:hypothetical protein